jgi:hypothetical protein
MQEYGQDNACQNREEGEEGSRTIAQEALEKKGDHESFPRRASVGLSCAIFLVGRKLTIVVTKQTKSVVPATSAGE